MKIIIITQGLSRIVLPVTNSGHEIVGIIECAPRKEKVSFLFEIIKKIYGKLAFRKKANLKSFSENKNIPYYYMDNGSDYSLELWVKKLAPDLIVVSSMSQLLKRNIFSIPSKGTINLHPSILPFYRGPNPDFWQYYDMEMNPGVTVHYIDEGEDTGDIIYQEKTYMPLGIKSPERLDILIGDLGANLLIKAINDLEKNIAPRMKQTNQEPTLRARNLKKDEHESIIEWGSWSINHIWHVLNGTEQWLNALPQPKGIYYGQRWVVKEVELVSESNIISGKLYRRNNRFCIGTNEGYIYLECKFSFKKLLMGLLLK